MLSVFKTIFSKSKPKEIIYRKRSRHKITNYINTILNFNDGSYHPYRKPNKGINYMHVNSDHPKQSKQSKQKENLTLFGSIHHTASSLKPILGEYSSN